MGALGVIVGIAGDIFCGWLLYSLIMMIWNGAIQADPWMLIGGGILAILFGGALLTGIFLCTILVIFSFAD